MPSRAFVSQLTLASVKMAEVLDPSTGKMVEGMSIYSPRKPVSDC